MICCAFKSVWEAV